MVESLLDKVLRPWVIDLRRGERSFDTICVMYCWKVLQPSMNRDVTFALVIVLISSIYFETKKKLRRYSKILYIRSYAFIVENVIDRYE